MQPTIILGGRHSDERGTLRFNNDFNVIPVKRLYVIHNSEVRPIRGWQGHKVEQRWFMAVEGDYEISVIKVDNWEQPSPHLPAQKFRLSQEKADVLHVPAGYITAIHALTSANALLVMSDYRLGEVQDEYRFPLDYFKDIF